MGKQWVKLQDLKLELEPASGACTMFDTSTVTHYLYACPKEREGMADRYGIAAFCKTRESTLHPLFSSALSRPSVVLIAIILPM